MANQKAWKNVFAYKGSIGFALSVIVCMGVVSAVALYLMKKADQKTAQVGQDTSATQLSQLADSPTPIPSSAASSTPTATSTPSSIPTATATPLVETANWKTYSSSQRGFSIQFPIKGGDVKEEWMYEEQGGVSFGPASKDASGNPLVSPASYLVINTEKNTYTSIDDWVKKETTSSPNLNMSYTTKDLTVGGAAAKQLSEVSSATKVVGVIKGDTLYRIDQYCGFCSPEDQVLFEKIYWSMLTTFQFTK